MARPGKLKSKKESLHDLSRKTLEPGQKEQYMKELLGESDRAAALVASAELEAYLAHLLMFKFSRLSADERNTLFFGPNAPLSTFATRTAIAYGLGVIHRDERDDLDCIRRIRNVFAHAMIPVTFETDAVSTECSRLHYRDIYGDESASFGQSKFRYLLTTLSLRKIFFDRAFEIAERSASSTSDEKSKADFLAQINALRVSNA